MQTYFANEDDVTSSTSSDERLNLTTSAVSDTDVREGQGRSTCYGKVVIIESRRLILGCILASVRGSFGDSVEAYSTVNDWLKRSATASHPGVVIFSAGDLSRNAAANEDLDLLLQQSDGVPVLVSSDNEATTLILSLLERGAKGYIPTSVSLPVWIEAVRLVRAGGIFAPASCLMSSLNQSPSDNDAINIDETPLLTARQASVVEELRRGKSNKVIAYELNMCESTVKVHVRNIMRKLQARNRTEVALMAESLLRQRGEPFR